jgi:uncharacterized membrane protein YkvA (DUF1232 family)
MKRPSLKKRARTLAIEVRALYFALRDPRTPWYARALAFAVAAYALSPIDLIPDFIPVLGYLDDLILLPLGIAAARALVPVVVMNECREKARTTGGPLSMRSGIAVVASIWLLVIVLALCFFFRR